jgi:excisionase family DNA binding protein
LGALLQTNEVNMNQILLNGVSLNDLLSQIGQLIDSKIGNLPLNENKQSGYLSRKEVAKLLKITLPTLHDWTKLGYLKAYKMGTRVLYKQCQVIETLENVPTFKHKKGVYNGK